jgi:pimeloyl-ACP methyl ester carboxylesterase
MQHQIRALAKTRFVIAADSRGHGRSTDTNDPLSYSRMANDMIKLLDALGINRTDVVGWSDGGIIGLELGMNSPERIRRLVAIGSNYDVEGLLDKPDPDAIPWRCRWLSWCETKQNRLARRKVNTMWLTQPHYTPADLAKITAPTLIIVGEHDAIKRSHTDQLARSIPGAVEEVISNASHFVINEQPNKVNARILSFLDQSLP